jgi:hypothetical protein
MKPDIWQDEKIGDLPHQARLTLLGLVTMADDEGRLVGRLTLIIGQVFPWDDDVTTARVGRWLEEIEAQGIVLRYEHAGKPYLAFRHWKRHQKINRATASLLPQPPDPVVVAENSVDGHQPVMEQSLNCQGEGQEDSSPRAQARAPLPLPSQSIPFSESGEVAREVAAVLAEAATLAGVGPPSDAAVARAMADFPDRDHLAVASELRFKVLAGETEMAKPALKYRRFLERADAIPFYRRAPQPERIDPPTVDWGAWVDEHLHDLVEQGPSMQMMAVQACHRIVESGREPTVELVRKRLVRFAA